MLSLKDFPADSVRLMGGTGQNVDYLPQAFCLKGPEFVIYTGTRPMDHRQLGSATSSNSSSSSFFAARATGLRGVEKPSFSSAGFKFSGLTVLMKIFCADRPFPINRERQNVFRV